jgi:GT2 family glycosyltransferase
MILTENDVACAYLLILGREAESDQIIAAHLDKSVEELILQLLGSLEFELNIYNQLRARRRPNIEGVDAPPPARLKEWLGTLGGLAPDTGQRAAAADSWFDLYEAVFTDAAISSLGGAAERLREPEFLKSLQWLAGGGWRYDILGEIESQDAAAIAGWVIDRGMPGRYLSVELYFDGVFAGSTPVNRFRREVEARYGGNGYAGFSLTLAHLPDGPIMAEVRESASQAVIGAFRLEPRRAPPLDELGLARAELKEVREILARLERRLPAVERGYTFALEEYADYFATYYGTPDLPVPRSGRAALKSQSGSTIIDAWHAPNAAVLAALQSCQIQSALTDQIAIVCRRGQDARIYSAAAAFAARASGRRVSIITGFVRHRALDKAFRRSSGTHVVFLDARAVAARDGTASFCAMLAQQPHATALFGDGDRLDGPASEARHRDPRFRTAFDYDLFLQSPDLGPYLCFDRAAVLAAGGLRAAPPVDPINDLILRLHEAGSTIAHVPRILSHLQHLGEGVPSLEVTTVHRATVEAHFARLKQKIEVEAHTDVLGGAIEGVLRVRYPLPATALLSVIIPTRDRRDLLEPCISSIIAAREFNRIPIEIIIVDNQSDDPDTIDYLRAVNGRNGISVLRHAAPFNWALLNNFAAAGAKGNVLVFLNNDTTVLSKDWSDELCRQALRPSVGAVGCRLLYGDGTLQHGGIVLGALGFVAHEGVGATGGGYAGRQKLVRRVSAVTGACMATRADIFQRLNGFDAARFPVDGNDIDFCLRLGRESLDVVYDPYVTLYHHESKSRGFNIDAAKLAAERRANAELWAAWGGPERIDPWYNPHFYRQASPFSRLTPPRPLD